MVLDAPNRKGRINLGTGEAVVVPVCVATSDEKSTPFAIVIANGPHNRYGEVVPSTFRTTGRNGPEK